MASTVREGQVKWGRVFRKKCQLEGVDSGNYVAWGGLRKFGMNAVYRNNYERFHAGTYREAHFQLFRQKGHVFRPLVFQYANSFEMEGFDAFYVYRIVILHSFMGKYRSL